VNELGKFAYNPSEVKKTKWMNKLYAEPPTRKELRFETKAKEPAAKQVNAYKTPHADREKTEAYCFSHLDFIGLSGMDVDHLQPYQLIRERQVRLLQFLNVCDQD